MGNLRTVSLFLLLGALGLCVFLFLIPDDRQATGAQDSAMAVEQDFPDRASDLSKAGDVTAREILEHGQVSERRSATPTPATRAAGHLLSIFDAQGNPVPEAQVLAWVAKEVRETAYTDAQGEVRIEGWSGAGGLMIHRPENYPYLHLLDGLTEDLVVYLPAGYALEGKVQFRRPWPHEEPLRLQVERLDVDFPEGVPTAIQLEDAFYDGHASVQADGTFRYRGLPEDWKGNLHLPKDVTLCSYQGPGKRNKWKGIRDLVPSSGLLLEVVPLRAITGKVVTPDGSEGVEGVHLTINMAMTAKGDDWRMYGVRSQQGGRFRIPFPIQSEEEASAVCAEEVKRSPFDLDIRLDGTDEWASAEFDFDMRGRVDPWALGDLPMGLKKEVLVRVVDLEGQPIPDARVQGENVSEATDADGFTVVNMSEERDTLRVAAIGYRTRLTDPIEEGAEFHEIALSPTNRLTVRFRFPDGLDREDWTIKLKAPEEIFEEGNQFMDVHSIHREYGLRMNQGGGGADGWYARYRLPEEEDTLEFWGFKPRNPITCSLADGYGQDLVSSAALLFGDSDHQVIDLIPPFQPRQFHGVVLDRTGRPVPDAELMLWGSENSGRGSVTDDEGRFDFGAVAAETVTLEIQHPEFADFLEGEVVVPMGGNEVRIELREPRSVVVQVQDPEGNPIQGVSLWYGTRHERLFAESADAIGTYRFPELTEAGCGIIWSCGGLSGSFFLEEGLEEYTLELPTMGSLRLRVEANPSEERRNFRFQFEPSDGTSPEAYDPARGLSLPREEGLAEKTFQAQRPGRYRVRLEYWSREEGNRGWKHHSDLGEFTVVAGEETEIVARL